MNSTLAPVLPDLLAKPDQPVLLAMEVARNQLSAVQTGLAPLVLDGAELRCVDGSNSFDPYAFSRLAQTEGVDPRPVLSRVFVTRAFTIHQLEAVVVEMLLPLADEEPRPLVTLLGLDHLFLEESLTLTERRQVLARISRHLQSLRRRGMRMLVTHEPPPPGNGRGWWRPMIASLGDRHCTVRAGENGLEIQDTTRRMR